MLMLGAGGSGALRILRLNLRECGLCQAPLSLVDAAGLWPVPNLRTSSRTDGAVARLTHACAPHTEIDAEKRHGITTLQLCPRRYKDSTLGCKIKERTVCVKPVLDRVKSPTASGHDQICSRSQLTSSIGTPCQSMGTTCQAGWARSLCAPSLPWKPSPAVVVVLLLLLLALLLLLLLVVVVVASASTTIAPQKARFLPVWCEMDRWCTDGGRFRG